MYTTLTRILTIALFCLAVSCKPTDTPETTTNPQAPWLTNLIQQLEQEAPANPPAKIYRYTYNNLEVYYLTGRCCDIPSKLFDKDGNQLCAPDGGITGKGDGRCPDFFEKRTNATIIWEDKRES
ncbi:hypothetical protein KB205_05540 [Microvirga sp. STS03]|uniref:DUF6970 domain-containing protein n=1 Tax=Pontibacter TaxID=323449 RepID=UPI001B82BC9D|nr:MULTISPECIES: hypothetical protein [Pontibacter]MBR0570067.1 hypothetical protein [Microvirga sp. STS03]